MNRHFATSSLPGSVVLTALLSLLAIIYAVINHTVTSALCVPAMMLSSVGDCILCGWERADIFVRGDRFVCGGIAFCFSHLVYGLAFALPCGRENLLRGLIFAAVLWLIFGAVLLVLALLRRGSLTMWALMCAYLAVEAFTTLAFACSYALTHAFTHSGAAYVSVFGGILFFLSDVAIALDKACNLRTADHNDRIIWILYPLGQLFLLLGALAI